MKKPNRIRPLLQASMDAEVVRTLRERAEAQGKTFSSVVEETLRAGLRNGSDLAALLAEKGLDKRPAGK